MPVPIGVAVVSVAIVPIVAMVEATVPIEAVIPIEAPIEPVIPVEAIESIVAAVSVQSFPRDHEGALVDDPSTRVTPHGHPAAVAVEAVTVVGHVLDLLHVRARNVG